MEVFFKILPMQKRKRIAKNEYVAQKNKPDVSKHIGLVL